jgi:hypothetical protein
MIIFLLYKRFWISSVELGTMFFHEATPMLLQTLNLLDAFYRFDFFNQTCQRGIIA